MECRCVSKVDTGTTSCIIRTASLSPRCVRIYLKEMVTKPVREPWAVGGCRMGRGVCADQSQARRHHDDVRSASSGGALVSQVHQRRELLDAEVRASDAGHQQCGSLCTTLSFIDCRRTRHGDGQRSNDKFHGRHRNSRPGDIDHGLEHHRTASCVWSDAPASRAAWHENSCGGSTGHRHCRVRGNAFAATSGDRRCID